MEVSCEEGDKLRFPKEAGILLTSRDTITFSKKKTALRAVSQLAVSLAAIATVYGTRWVLNLCATHWWLRKYSHKLKHLQIIFLRI